MLCFLLFALGCLILAILHPYTTYPLSLLVLRSIRRPLAIGATGTSPARFALVCCAFNEHGVIERKLRNSLELQRVLGDCELLFYSDASTDGTSDILAACPGIKAVIGKERAGKTAGINRLLASTDADIVIFTDANVIIDANSAACLKSYFRDPEVGMVTGRLTFLNKQASITAKVSDSYRQFEEAVKKLETDTGSVIYTDGTMFAMRRSLFVPVPPDLTDDLFTAIMVLIQGKRNVAAPDFIAYEQAATEREDELRRRVRIGCHVFNCHLVLWPRIRQFSPLALYKYVSHKLIRWFSGYFLVLAIAVTLAIIGLQFGFQAAALVLLVAFAVALASLLTHLPLLSTVCEGVLVMIAVAYGVSLAIKGEQFRVWSVAASSRD